MFRDVYKQAMDDIEPRGTLLKETLEKSENKPKRNFKKITSYVSSIAAAFVILAVSFVYSQNNMSDINKGERMQEDIILNDKADGEVILARNLSIAEKTSCKIESTEDAILLAKNAINCTYNSAEAVYDDEDEIWCVSFYADSEKIVVYLDSTGEIKEIIRENI